MLLINFGDENHGLGGGISSSTGTCSPDTYVDMVGIIVVDCTVERSEPAFATLGSVMFLHVGYTTSPHCNMPFFAERRKEEDYDEEVEEDLQDEVHLISRI